MQFRSILFLSLVLFFSVSMARLQAKGPAYSKPKQAKQQDADFEIQGEYSGELAVDGGTKFGSQVIALGNGKFALTVYFGGLPGDGWGGEKLPTMEATKKDDGSVAFHSEEGGVGTLKDGVITVMHDGEDLGQLKKVNRKSKTLRKKAPKDAIVLFNGTDTDHWENGKMDGNTLTFAPRQPGKSGLTSKERFGDHSVHIEFRLPYMPEDRGQGRGNSGIYLQGRYEVQMLDSFGLEGKDNECGGIYQISKPKVNMCYPPLTWQTYDIDFTAAEYNNAGELLKSPHMTVKHNGVVIHQDLELPRDTTASPMKVGPEDGPIYLQDHGNPVRYRNIWVVSKSSTN